MHSYSRHTLPQPCPDTEGNEGESQSDTYAVRDDQIEIHCVWPCDVEDPFGVQPRNHHHQSSLGLVGSLSCPMHNLYSCLCACASLLFFFASISLSNPSSLAVFFSSSLICIIIEPGEGEAGERISRAKPKWCGNDCFKHMLTMSCVCVRVSETRYCGMADQHINGWAHSTLSSRLICLFLSVKLFRHKASNRLINI